MSGVANKIREDIEKVEEELGVNKEIDLPIKEDEGDSRVIGNIYVHSKKCLNCTHFAPNIAKKVYYDCHYSKGNENCPASEVKVVVMLPYETIANALLKAHVTGDAAKMSSLMARLNRQDPEEVVKVLAKYKELLTQT